MELFECRHCHVESTVKEKMGGLSDVHHEWCKRFLPRTHGELQKSLRVMGTSFAKKGRSSMICDVGNPEARYASDLTRYVQLRQLLREDGEKLRGLFEDAVGKHTDRDAVLGAVRAALLEDKDAAAAAEEVEVMCAAALDQWVLARGYNVDDVRYEDVITGDDLALDDVSLSGVYRYLAGVPSGDQHL